MWGVWEGKDRAQYLHHIAVDVVYIKDREGRDWGQHGPQHPIVVVVEVSHVIFWQRPAARYRGTRKHKEGLGVGLGLGLGSPV